MSCLNFCYFVYNSNNKNAGTFNFQIMYFVMIIETINELDFTVWNHGSILEVLIDELIIQMYLST